MNTDTIPTHIRTVLLAKARQQGSGEIIASVWAFKWQVRLTLFMLLSLAVAVFIGQPIGLLLSLLLTLPVFVIAAGTVWWTLRLESNKSQRWIARYCPDGRLPFCINCEYDLRGCAGEHCPECGQKAFCLADTDNEDDG